MKCPVCGTEYSASFHCVCVGGNQSVHLRKKKGELEGVGRVWKEGIGALLLLIREQL